MISVADKKIGKRFNGQDEIASAFVGEDKVYTSFTPYELPIVYYNVQAMNGGSLASGDTLPISRLGSNGSKKFYYALSLASYPSPSPLVAGKYRLEGTLEFGSLGSPDAPFSDWTILGGYGDWSDFVECGVGEVTAVTQIDGGRYQVSFACDVDIPVGGAGAGYVSIYYENANSQSISSGNFIIAGKVTRTA